MDIEKLKRCYDDLGIKYHELVTDGGYIYIRKLYPHEKKGYFCNMLNGDLHKITTPEQLGKYLEFDPSGNLASW